MIRDIHFKGGKGWNYKSYEYVNRYVWLILATVLSTIRSGLRFVLY